MSHGLQLQSLWMILTEAVSSHVSGQHAGPVEPAGKGGQGQQLPPPPLPPPLPLPLPAGFASWSLALLAPPQAALHPALHPETLPICTAFS